MQTERFEIPRRQFSQLFIFAGVLAGVGILLDFLALVVLRNVPLVLLMWGIGLTLAGAFALYDPRNQGVDTVKVLLRSGESFQFGAPTNSPVMSDPEFNSKFERIVAAWHSGVAARN